MARYADLVVAKCPKQPGPISHDEFVMLYDGPKRKRYEAAARNLLDRELVPTDWEINVFIKDETVCSWSKSDPAPRLISPRSPEYCLELGCFLKPVEHMLYKAVARVWGEVTIAKGLNFNQRGEVLHKKWEKYDDPVAVGLDASRFDQHVSVSALEWEHHIYLSLFKRSKRKLQWLLGKQLSFSGRAYLDDKMVSYSGEGSRMSGDMNTALGNCLIMTGLVWSYLAEKNLAASLMNDGDDCVVVMERRDLAAFQDGLKEWFTNMGFTMKVEAPVDVFEQIEFCQTHPVWNGEGWTMCRNVHKCLFTDVVHVGRTWQEVVGIRESVAVSGQVWAKGIPVLGAFYTALATGAKQRIPYNSGTYWNAKGCTTGTTQVTNEARDSFQLAFGLSHTEQMAIEEMYRSLPSMPFEAPRANLVFEADKDFDDYPLYISEALQTLLKLKDG
jgi:hypothetical protein